jgi:peptide chain release factor subunit 1
MAQLEMRLDSLARSLASFRPERGLRISLFLDLDPSVVPTAKDLSSHVRSIVDDARRRVDELSDGLAHEEGVGARDDLERAQTFLEEDLDRSGAAGFALYASGLDGAWYEVPLATAVRDDAHVGPIFVLAPLLESLEGDRELILAAVGRERGTVWRTRNGRTELLEDRTEEIGRRHDQGGWSQARFQRSVDEDALDHFRDVAGILAHTIQPGSGALLLVACVEEQRAKFEELLVPHVREALLGWTTIEAHAGEDALEPEAQRLLAARLESERAGLLERWREVRANGDRATASWAEALEAAADGAVDAALVDGRSPEAWVCPVCGRGSLQSGSCPLDGTELVAAPGGALEVVIRGTLANAGQIRRVDTLAETEGIAALLRFPVRPPDQAGPN